MCPKHWSSLCWNTSPTTVAPKDITVYLNLPSSVLKVVRNDEVSSSCWCWYPFLQSHTDMIHASPSRMSYIPRCHEIIGFPRYHFIKIDGVQTDSKFQVAKLVFPLHKYKSVNPWVASCTVFKTPTFSFLSISCLKASFKCIGIGLQGVCLGVIFGSNWMWYGGLGKHSLPWNTSG